LHKEIEYLNLEMVNVVAMAVEIRKGQLEDAQRKEILQIIKENKTSDFYEYIQFVLWLGKQIHFS
jgi:hypothetical protein